VTVSQRADAPADVTLADRAQAIVENARNALALLLRPPIVPATRLVARRQHYRVIAILAAMAVVASMVFVDARVYQLALGLPMWAIDGFYDITDLGRSGWVLVPTGALIAVIALVASPTLDHMTRGVLALIAARIGFVFLAVGIPGLFVAIVKRFIGRVRPSPAGPFAYEPCHWRPDFASLPSGHTTTAFATLVAVGALFPRARPFLWGFALLIAVSRVAVSAHFASDVLAGAAVGVLGAWCVRDWFALRRLGFVVTRDGEVKALPGPSPGRIKRVARTLIGP
jgi:membrane-associated phospholipid phosphatase